MDINSEKMAPQTSLFQVFLRLRPPQVQKQQKTEQWLLVEPPTTSSTTATVDEESQEHTKAAVAAASTHITLQPPNDSRKRAVERFGFTKIFPEDATQSNIFEETGTAETIRHLLDDGRDGLVATLGVTGSGKSHTILGTRSQRGLTQMTLDVLFRSIDTQVYKIDKTDVIACAHSLASLQASDPSEAQILSASHFLEMVYGDRDRSRASRAQTPMTGYGSRAQTPMVGSSSLPLPGSYSYSSPDEHKPSMKFDNDHLRGTKYPSTDNMVSLCSREDTSLPNVELIAPKEAGRQTDGSPRKIPFWQRLNPQRTHAKSYCVQESIPSHHIRRPPMPQPSTFATSPDVSEYAFNVDRRYDYAVIVSMYEVYNDRIFDLLSNASSQTAPAMTTRQGAALSKGLTRRPLLFKNTEMSPDRKVVAGLRKIACTSYEEAMMVLETGLTERRVAGTGSNSVSSRSHGFFCIEVKKSPRNMFTSSKEWMGGTLSIVDLAGSERARNAKTTGSTLAEAGKINESLMYLGQCLQVQSDCQQDGSKPIVPFRQCKLTELLFSNSFPSSPGVAVGQKQPQRAVMIVTADPQGDFNATSQILRYSALAREVTVPRIPSVTSAIAGGFKQPSDRNTPQEHYFSMQELEQATNEVQRMAEECEALAVRLAEEEIKRTEAELKFQAAEEKLVVSEQEIREECWQEMEVMLETEKERWRAAWEEERVNNEEYIDGKIDILSKTTDFKIHEESTTDSRMEELERENEALRARLQALEQEMHTKSPTKKSRTVPKTPSREAALQETSNTNIMTNPFLSALKARDSGSALKLKKHADDVFDGEDVSPRKLSLRSSVAGKQSIETQPDAPGTIKKKQRKLTTRKWDLGDPDEV